MSPLLCGYEGRRPGIISYVPFIGKTELNARFHVLNFTGLGSHDGKKGGADRPDWDVRASGPKIPQ
jgi:hypothetical protein